MGLRVSRCRFTSIAVMPATFNLNSARSSQTHLQTNALNVAGPSVSWCLRPHSASKVQDGTVTATAQQQSLLNQKAIQLLELELELQKQGLQRRLYQQTQFQPLQRQQHRLQLKHPLRLKWKRSVRLLIHRLPLVIKLR